MKQYIDGIKNDKMSKSWFGKMLTEAEQSSMRLTIRPIKHIPVYEPMTKKRILHLMATNEDISGVKWVNGQPYELIVLGKN